MKVRKVSDVMDAWYWNGEINSLRCSPDWVRSAVVSFPRYHGDEATFRVFEYPKGFRTKKPCYIIKSKGIDDVVSLASPDAFARYFIKVDNGHK
jgi:hypothetical protein